jgi:hypothetical protein
MRSPWAHQCRRLCGKLRLFVLRTPWRIVCKGRDLVMPQLVRNWEVVERLSSAAARY